MYKDMISYAFYLILLNSSGAFVFQLSSNLFEKKINAISNFESFFNNLNSWDTTTFGQRDIDAPPNTTVVRTLLPKASCIPGNDDRFELIENFREFDWNSIPTRNLEFKDKLRTNLRKLNILHYLKYSKCCQEEKVKYIELSAQVGILQTQFTPTYSMKRPSLCAGGLLDHWE